MHVSNARSDASEMETIDRVVLIGFSGTGKSTVARILASRLGWTPIDLDDQLAVQFGMSIPEVFATHGEAAFRAAERKALLAALDADKVVIATGGGAVVDPAVWEKDGLGRAGTLVVALDAEPAEMLERLRRQQEAEGDAAGRPMLAGDDPLARIRQLKAKRQEAYDRAAITLIVDAISPEEIAAEIASLLEPVTEASTATIRLEAPSGHSEIYIGPGARTAIGQQARERYRKARRAWIISDTNVDALHGKEIEDRVVAAGLTPCRTTVAPGEGSKSWQTAGQLYDWLLGGGVERSDLAIALGGGVIGDLAGFVAATVLRGIGLVQAPTSLLAMVDSSVGGKTGINHAAGKNLIGAFYQPPLVVIDPTYLQTLPRRELVAGWAEVIKHAVIQPSTPGGERADLLRFLERNVANLVNLREPATTYAIRRNVALKAAVVQADEREAGIRSFLNFGHTLGHAIEAAGYHLLHGEAIALGMRAAIALGQALDTADAALAKRVDSLLVAFGLPLTAEFDGDQALQLLTSDKKRVAGVQRWVLPQRQGGVHLRQDVTEQMIRDAIALVQAS